MASEMSFEMLMGEGRTDIIYYAYIVYETLFEDILICSILVITCMQGLYQNLAVNLLYMSCIERTPIIVTNVKNM